MLLETFWLDLGTEELLRYVLGPVIASFASAIVAIIAHRRRVSVVKPPKKPFKLTAVGAIAMGATFIQFVLTTGFLLGFDIVKDGDITNWATITIELGIGLAVSYVIFIKSKK